MDKDWSVLMSKEKGVEMQRWYAIKTRPREEDRADENLKAWGVEAFAPHIRKQRFNQFTGKPTTFSQPLFPGYIFARFDAASLLHKVQYTRGVQVVVSFNNLPVTIEDEVIELIKSQVGDDGFIRLGGDLKRGDKVTIKDGTLEGLSGIFDSHMNDKRRVMVLLTVINYQASVVVEKDFVRKTDGPLVYAQRP